MRTPIQVGIDIGGQYGDRNGAKLDRQKATEINAKNLENNDYSGVN